MTSSTKTYPEAIVENSKQLGGLIGPTVSLILVSESPLIQPHLYDAQIPPVIYLSGIIMFIAGLALVRAHNVWERDWTVLITLAGWFLLILGLLRSFTASQYQHLIQRTTSLTFNVLEISLLLVALAITFKAYSPSSERTK